VLLSRLPEKNNFGPLESGFVRPDVGYGGMSERYKKASDMKQSSSVWSPWIIGANTLKYIGTFHSEYSHLCFLMEEVRSLCGGLHHRLSCVSVG
jgi:hypothetical protein